MTKYFYLILIILFLTSCDSTDKGTTQQWSHTQGVRIITLSPHLAELAVSAGALGNIVGVVSYSDFPDAIKNIQNVGDAFKLDYETIIALKPDYLLVWKGGTPMAVIEKLKSLKLTVIETEINTIADITKTLSQIAELTDTKKTAEKNIFLFNQKLLELKQKKHEPISVFIEITPQPLYTVSSDHWMSEAASICGYDNIFKDLPQLSAPVNIEAVISKNPQSILNISLQVDKQWDQWKTLDAVKNNRIITISPNYFSRPSLRLLDGITQLCQF